MLLALEGKDKIGFIDGSCKRSNTDEVLGKQWDRVNPIVLGWILNSISEELFLGQIFSKRAKHVWEDLKETYDKLNALWKQYDALWKQYDAMIELPKYVCNASEEVLPDVRSAYAIISREESHRVAVGSIADKVGGFGLNNNKQGGGFGVVCENCGLNGHNIDRCLKIIGYPTEFRKKKSGQNFKKLSVSNNNFVGKSSSSGFTDEQMATLISLIKDNQVGKNMHANMAGANQHMTYTDKELDNVLDISHLKIKVCHPNGTEAYISKIGNLRLSNGLTLYDVMVIPKYYDLNLKNVLGIGEQCEGLYYYNDKDLVILHTLAKQTKEPFPLRDHTSKRLDDLVHLDLWGLYKFDKFIHLEMLKSSNYDSNARVARQDFKDYIQMEAKSFKGLIIQHMESIEQCIVKRARHEQEIHNRLKRLNERKLKIQECMDQKVKASDASSGEKDCSRIVLDKGNNQGLENQINTSEDESSRSRNECNDKSTSGDDKDIRPSYDTEPMVEVDSNVIPDLPDMCDNDIQTKKMLKMRVLRLPI
ncbi:hypothetical protein Tco_1127795 [Tanacetum coccineum]